MMSLTFCLFTQVSGSGPLGPLVLNFSHFRLLDEVRQECGVEDTSSEEEETSPVQRSKKQLFKSLCPIPSPEPTVPSVQATFSAKPTCLTNGEDGKNLVFI